MFLLLKLINFLVGVACVLSFFILVLRGSSQHGCCSPLCIFNQSELLTPPFVTKYHLLCQTVVVLSPLFFFLYCIKMSRLQLPFHIMELLSRVGAREASWGKQMRSKKKKKIFNGTVVSNKHAVERKKVVVCRVIRGGRVVKGDGIRRSHRRIHGTQVFSFHIQPLQPRTQMITTPPLTSSLCRKPMRRHMQHFRFMVPSRNCSSSLASRLFYFIWPSKYNLPD